MRNIGAITKSTVTLPIAVYADRKEAETTAADMSATIDKALHMKLEGDGRTVRDFLASIGIDNVSHGVMGPFDIQGMEKPMILNPRDWRPRG